jgi:phosphoribosylpyrophosphate synthetase
MQGSEIKIFTGNSNPELAKRICDILGVGLGVLYYLHYVGIY